MTKKITIDKDKFKKMNKLIEDYHDDTEARLAALESIAQDLMKYVRVLKDGIENIQKHWTHYKYI